MFKRIWALARKEFIHLSNDWWLPVFMLLGGAMELTVVAWATSRPITNLPLMVFDQSQTAESRTVTTMLENTNTFSTPQEVYDMSTIDNAMERGTVTAALIIPPNYAEDLQAFNGRPQLQFIINGAENTPAEAARRAIQGLAQNLDWQIVIKRMNLSSDEFNGFNPSLRIWFNENLSEAFYTTPAELGLMMEFTILLFAALAFSRERELGTIEQLLVMPFSSMEIVIGKTLPVIIISFSDFFLMLGMIHFVFGVPVRGSFLLLIVLAIVYILVELSKGLIISVISHTQHQAFLLVMLVGMTDFMFTGYAAPVESMPPALQWLANLIPAHHWLTILRGILLKGAGLNVLWPNVVIMIGVGLVIGVFSLQFIRKALD